MKRQDQTGLPGAYFEQLPLPGPAPGGKTPPAGSARSARPSGGQTSRPPHSGPQASPWVWVLRFVFTLGLVCSVAFIFQNSMQIAEASSARSQQAMQRLNSALKALALGPLSEHTVRKLAHFAEFALLGFWFMLCLRVYTRRFVRHTGWPLFFGLLVANIDELIQLYVPGRSSSVRDVFLDFAGVLAGLLLALVLLLFVRMCSALWKARGGR